MIPINRKAGPVWRCAPCGSTEVYLSRIEWLPGTAKVHSRGAKGPWAKQAMTVPVADLFETQAEAREEFRRRRRGSGYKFSHRPYAA